MGVSIINDKQQPAVEYLVEQLFPKALSAEQYYHIELAKAMHKEEVIKAYNESFRLRDKPYSTAIKYYNETFGGNNEEK